MQTHTHRPACQLTYQKGKINAKAIFFFLIAIGIAIAGWHWYTNTPDYQAEQQLAAAKALENDGQQLAAAQGYANLLTEYSNSRNAARAAFMRLIKQDWTEFNASEQAELFTLMPSDAAWFTIDINTLGLNYLEQQTTAPATQRWGVYRIMQQRTDLLPAQQTELLSYHESILRAALQADPKNLELTDALAQWLEKQNDMAEAEALLTLFEATLTKTTPPLEAHRILGQIRMNQGELDQAFVLLQPYTTAKLANMQAAETAYNTHLDSLWDRHLSTLQNGYAPQSFYNQYDAADGDEAAQNQLVQAYIWNKIERDIEAGQLRQAYIDTTNIVSTAFDLGILRLQRGQAITDPTERENELKAAESLFLAVQGVAGDSPEYKLYLGQVYYWLGKQTEGQALFDEVLASQSDDVSMQLAVSHVLRNVGDNQQARALAEQAYNQASTDEERYGAALQRSVLNTDLDDRLLWLQRVDLSVSANRAGLAEARAYKARQDGDSAEAIRQLQTAADFYQDVPESASQLNNSALVYMSLYQLNGDENMVTASMQNMEKAIQLEPTDSTLLINAASMLQRAAIRSSLQSQNIDWLLIDSAPTLDDISLLYTNSTGLTTTAEQLFTTDSMQKAVEYYERLTVLSPQDTNNYFILYSLYGKTHDAEKLNSLAARMQQAQPDKTDYQTAFEKQRSGDAETDNQKAQNLVLETLLPALNKAQQTNPGTYTLALGRITSALSLADESGINKQQLDDLIRRSQQLFQQHPSRHLDGTLNSLLCHRAVASLTPPALQDAWQRDRRQYKPCDWLLVQLQTQTAEWQTYLRTQPDVQAFLQGYYDSQNRFPQFAYGQDWLVTQWLAPEQADTVRQTIQNNPLLPSHLIFSEYATPWASSTAFDNYYSRVATGNTTAAKQQLQVARDAGALLPAELPTP